MDDQTENTAPQPSSDKAAYPVDTAVAGDIEPVTAPIADALVSCVLIADGGIGLTVRAVRAAQAFLSERFVFHELLLVMRSDFHAQNAAALRQVLSASDLRAIVLRDGVGEYRAAMLGATESIGDVVMIVPVSEAEVIDMSALYAAAAKSGSAVVRAEGRAGMFSRLGGQVLSLVSGYRVDPRMMRSCAHHRAYLNKLAGQPDGDIALRFMRAGSSDAAILIHGQDMTSGQGAGNARSRLHLFRQFGIASEILVNAPPYLLRLMAAASLLGVISAVIYALYAVTLFVIGFPLQPGWLTTSLALSAMTGFICLGLGAIAIALYQILAHLRDTIDEEIVEEIGNIDLFRDFHDINVDTRRSV